MAKHTRIPASDLPDSKLPTSSQLGEAPLLLPTPSFPRLPAADTDPTNLAATALGSQLLRGPQPRPTPALDAAGFMTSASALWTAQEHRPGSSFHPAFAPWTAQEQRPEPPREARASLGSPSYGTQRRPLLLGVSLGSPSYGTQRRPLSPRPRPLLPQ